MHEFWYGYVKPKYGEESISCYMDAGYFIVNIKMVGIYVGIGKDVERRFKTSKQHLGRPFSKGENKKSWWINEG